jgi:hypothetical protein
MSPSGIELATFRFVAQCLNHCATACPIQTEVFSANISYILSQFIFRIQYLNKIMIVRDQDQQDAHFFLMIYFN